MANWNLPTTTTNYLAYPGLANDRDVDAITFGYGSPTNLPVHSMRFNRSVNIFEEWDGIVWNPTVLGIAGGGTGGNTPASARTALGLGSMATQNSNAVNITGGTITGVNLNANDITSGIMALARGGTGASLALGAPGTVMLSNGTQVVFAPGTQIAELNASNLTTGVVPIGRLPAGIAYLAGDNRFTGSNTFSATNTEFTIEAKPGYIPVINFYSIGNALNKKRSSILAFDHNLYFQITNDDGTGGVNPFYVVDGVIGGDGGNIFNLNASYLYTGIVPTARMGSGVANSATYLRGDNTWQPISVASGIPAGLIGMFDTACPVGWTRVAALDNRFPLGGTGYGSAGGTTSHSHGITGTTSFSGNHGHTFSGRTDPSTDLTPVAQVGSNINVRDQSHTHTYSGATSADGNHSHDFSTGTDTQNFYPPYLTVVFCRKD